MFRNKYRDAHKRVITVSGEKIVDTYILDEDAGKLVFAGKTNIWEEIQSFKDSTDINTILKMMEVGDDSKLHAKKGVYIDVSDLPRNASQLHEASIYTRSQYNNLPEELRTEFGSFDEFIDADAHTIQSILDNYNSKLEVSNNGDVNESEHKESEVE